MQTKLDPSGASGLTPPANPTFTPTVAAVTAAGSGTSVSVFSLAPGDIVSELWINIQTTAASSQTNEQITVLLTNEIGQQLVSCKVPGNCQSATSTTNVFTYIAVIPLLYRAAINGRTLTLSVTAGVDGIVGHASLGVRRNFRPFEQWRT